MNNIENNNITVNDIIRIRKIINLTVNILEDNIDYFSKENNGCVKNKELIDFLIGKKESVVSIITKLTNLIIKLIPLEEKIDYSKNIESEKLSDEDMEILEKYIDKCSFLFNQK